MKNASFGIWLSLSRVAIDPNTEVAHPSHRNKLVLMISLQISNIADLNCVKREGVATPLRNMHLANTQ